MKTKALTLNGAVVAVFTKTHENKYTFTYLSAPSPTYVVTSDCFNTESEALHSCCLTIGREVYSKLQGTLDLYKDHTVVSGVSEVLFHEIEWYFNVPVDEQNDYLRDLLEDEAEKKAKADIFNGYQSGELCYSYYEEDEDHNGSEVDYCGYWSFKTEKG